MKKLLISFSVFVCATTFAQEHTASSKIEAVTVYLQNARITRKAANVSLQKGENTILIKGASDKVDVNSIQGKIEGAGALLSVNYKLDYLEIEKNKSQIEAYRDSIEVAEDEKSFLQSELEVFKNEKAILLKNDDLKGEESGFEVAELRSLLTYQRERGLELNKLIFDYNKKVNAYTEKIQKYVAQLNELNGLSKRPKGTFEVKIMTNQGGKCGIELNYLVANAGWQPIYDLRVDDIKEPVDLVYKANVYQNSGNDWEDVQLTLSNGSASTYEDYPELNTLYARIHEKYKQKRGRGHNAYKLYAPSSHSNRMESRSLTLRGDAEEAAVSEPKPELAYAVVENENQLSTEYTINLPQDIKSDYKKVLVSITNYELKADYHYYAVPKKDKNAYLLVDVFDWYQYNLLPAQTNIFFEGAFVGKTHIDPNSTDDTLSISLGVDKQVQVERTRINDKSGSKVLGLNKTQTLSFDYKVLNNKKDKIKIEIIDQVPVATNDDIDVEVEELGGGTKDKSGIVTWKFELESSQSKSWEFQYSVKYPKNKILSGEQ